MALALTVQSTTDRMSIMSKRNLRYAATLVRAIAILDGFRWTWVARYLMSRIVRQLIAKGID